ncbi:hypothetical protein ABCS02_20035 [Microbacterium sp. X-17]|uniref:hypothetical protein n=1 Tax=Microbacterium sp. X-17 TaxID=3144404 RepID=UPI0031F597CE
MVAAALIAILSATPDPNVPNEDLITPGPWGFAVIAFIAVAVVFLITDMMRRIRRARFRSEVREELDAEQAGEKPQKPRDEDPPA